MTTPAPNTDPRWVTTARTYLGAAEIPGPETAPFIRGMLLKLGAWWRDDATPWCGTFVAACLRESGIEIPKHWYRARAYLDWGVPLAAPCMGCIVVYARGASGHVGFIVGRDSRGNLMTLGGNQGNKVSIAPFVPSRVLGYRWPPGQPEARMYPPPVLGSAGAVSNDEA